MGGEDDDSKKSHRKRQAGRKADKKKSKNPHEQELTAKQRNPKAFSYHSVNKVARAVRRYATGLLPVINSSDLKHNQNAKS